MVNVTLNTKTRSCIASTTFLGYEGENKANKLIFKFDDLFVDGFAQINIKRETESGYVNLDQVDETYELEVKKSLVSKIGDVTFQLQISKSDGSIYKYDAFVMTVKDAIDTDAPMPEEYPTWMQQANIKLAEIDEAITTANETVEEIITAKENGEFKGEKGDNYVITDDDIKTISSNAVSEVEQYIQPQINEIKETSERAETIAKGRATGYVFNTIEDLNLWLQNAENTNKLVLGDNLYIRAVGVPDYWWDGFEKQVLETQKVDLSEYVKSVELNEYVKNTEYANVTKVGVVKVPSWGGVGATTDGSIFINKATDKQIISKSEPYIPVTTQKIDLAVKVGVTTNAIELTDEEKTNACNWLGTGKMITLTQSEYDALEVKDENTYYYIVEE